MVKTAIYKDTYNSTICIIRNKIVEITDKKTLFHSTDDFSTLVINELMTECIFIFNHYRVNYNSGNYLLLYRDLKPDD
jgi:hypothetical protein